MVHALRLTILIPALLLCAAPHASAKRQKKSDSEISQEVKEIKKQWQEKDSTFNATLKKAYGYVIFPEVGKGGFIVGASHGEGEVYKKAFIPNRTPLDTLHTGQWVSLIRMFDMETQCPR